MTGPSVPGVHAFGKPMIGQGVGVSTCALKRSFTHPRPNVPQFSMRGFDAPHSPQLLHRPVRRLLDVRRARQPRPVHVGQVAGDLHHLRALESLFLDLVDGVVVDGFVDGGSVCAAAGTCTSRQMTGSVSRARATSPHGSEPPRAMDDRRRRRTAPIDHDITPRFEDGAGAPGRSAPADREDRIRSRAGARV